MEKIINESIFDNYIWKQRKNGEYKLSKRGEENNRNVDNHNGYDNDNSVSPSKNKIDNNGVNHTNKDQSNGVLNLDERIVDNSQKYKIDQVVMTEWGLGKIVNITEEGIAIVKIEGNEVEFPLSGIKSDLTVLCCVLCRETSFWTEIKVGFDYSVTTLKKKISIYVKCHPSQIVLVHNGQKIDKNVNIFELGIYEKDVFLAVIKDPQEMLIIRSKNHKTINKPVHHNAIKMKVNQDIVLTGIGFYKNINIDVFYDLLIYEEDISGNPKLILSEKKIPITCEGSKENEVFKYKINNIDIKENVTYQIHQYLLSSENNQYIGAKCSESVEEKNTLINFQFSECVIQGKTNSTDMEQGMIPAIYFYIKTDN